MKPAVLEVEGLDSYCGITKLIATLAISRGEIISQPEGL
jgi:hypothetical protein